MGDPCAKPDGAECTPGVDQGSSPWPPRVVAKVAGVGNGNSNTKLDVVTPRGVTIECCAGSAKLTFWLRSVGFDGTGVDTTRNRHRKRGAIIILDLTTTTGQEQLWRLLRALGVVH
eukprot:7503807-Heterocapsa_arctica.AAC.1